MIFSSSGKAMLMVMMMMMVLLGFPISINASGEVYQATVCQVVYHSDFILKWGIAAAEFHKSHFPGINVTIRPLFLSNTGDEVQKGEASSWDTASCDYIVGPGYSSAAMTISPSLKAPMIDAGASSVDLSNRIRFPYFFRTFPNDVAVVKQADKLVQQLNWTAVTVIATEDAWANSFVSTLSHQIASRGGYIEQIIDAKPLTSSDVEWDFDDVIATLRKGASRIVILAILPWNGALETFVRRAVELKLSDEFVFVFTETGRSYTKNVTGSLYFSVNTNTPVIQQYCGFTHNDIPAAVLNQFDMQQKVSTSDFPSCSPTSAVYIGSTLDAWWLVFSALSKHKTLGTSAKNITINDRVQALQTQTLPKTAALNPGISLGTAGEPSYLPLSALNSIPDTDGTPTGRVVGYWRDNTITVSNDAKFYILGKEYQKGSLPSDVHAASEDEGFTPGEELLLRGLPVLFVVSLVSLGTVVYLHRTNLHRFAPRTEEKPLYLVKAKIYRGNILWETCGDDMIKVVKRHNELIRDLIGVNQGYEVISGKADEFMVVFQNADDALDFAVGIQLQLMAEDWDTDALDAYYKGLDSRRAVRKSIAPVARPPQESSTNDYSSEAADTSKPSTAVEFDNGFDEDYDVFWNGPRESISIGMGLMSIDRDVESGRFEYFGPVIEEVNEMCDATKGGQIAISELFVEQLCRAHNVVFTTIGSIRVEGTEVRAMQAMPYSLTGRQFVSNMKIGYDRTDLWDDSEIEFSSMDSSKTSAEK